MQMGTPRISRGVQNYGIHVSDSLDGYVADGRFSLAGLLKAIARGTFGAQDADLDDDCFHPRQEVLGPITSSP